MKTTIWRSLALLLAGALIGILGNIIISVLLNQICLNNIYVLIIFIFLLFIFIALILLGSGASSYLRRRFNLWLRKYFPKVGILSDIGYLFRVNSTAEIEQELNEGNIPERLRNKFEKKDVILPEAITVEKAKDNEWKINLTTEKEKDKKSIHIGKDGKKLDIYCMTKEEISTGILPEEWKRMVERHSRIKVRLINIKKNFNWYNAIINPYGAVYPESDLKSFDTLNKIFDYVLAGGLFVNVQDIFGYFAYNALLKPGRKLETPPPVYGIKYASDGSIERLIPARPFERTPAMEMLGLRIINTENSPKSTWNIEFTDTFRKATGAGKCGVTVRRAVIVEKNVESVVKPEKLQSGEDITPLCFVNYGNDGKFLLSLLWISDQDEEIQEWLKTVLSKLVVSFVKNRA